MVERFNRTMEQFSKVVKRHQTDWDKYLPLFLLIYRVTDLETTGQTPIIVVPEKVLTLPCYSVFSVQNL